MGEIELQTSAGTYQCSLHDMCCINARSIGGHITIGSICHQQRNKILIGDASHISRPVAWLPLDSGGCVLLMRACCPSELATQEASKTFKAPMRSLASGPRSTMCKTAYTEQKLSADMTLTIPITLGGTWTMHIQISGPHIACLI